jgi:hypothetical protein
MRPRLWLLVLATAILMGTHACGTSGDTGAQGTGAGAACTTTAQCASGTVCGYWMDSLCSATGQCVVSDCAMPDCSDMTSGAVLCGCDGKPVSLVATGYVSAPYANQIGNCDQLDASSGPDASDGQASDAGDGAMGMADAPDASDAPALETSADAGPDGADDGSMQDAPVGDDASDATGE